MMKHIPRTIAAVCAAALLVPAVAFSEIKAGSPAPDLTLKDVTGTKTVTLSKYRGKKVVYLAFFATWCANCREEMETLKALYAAHKGEGLELLAIDVKERPDKVQKFVEKHGLTFPVLLDENAAAAQAYQLVGFPANLIVDGAGTVRYSGTRPPENFKELFAQMKATIAAKKK